MNRDFGRGVASKELKRRAALKSFKEIMEAFEGAIKCRGAFVIRWQGSLPSCGLAFAKILAQRRQRN